MKKGVQYIVKYMLYLPGGLAATRFPLYDFFARIRNCDIVNHVWYLLEGSQPADTVGNNTVKQFNKSQE